MTLKTTNDKPIEDYNISEFLPFYDAMHMATHGILISDLQGYITNVNESLVQMYGSSDRKELLGKQMFELLVKEDRERAVQDSINLSKSERGKIYQYSGLSKSGCKIPIEVTASYMKDNFGKVIGFFIIVRDVASKTALEKEFRKNNRAIDLIGEKLQVVGSHCRHDILNKLQIINFQIFLAKRKGNYEQAIQVISGASNQIKDILMFSRYFERIGLETLQEIDVDLVLREAVSMFPDLKGINPIIECGGLRVKADSLLLRVFYNLIDNTLKYGDKTTQFRAYFEKAEGQYKFFFEDDGVGISICNKTQLFSRGFGKNTGLGLFLVKKIVESYGWQVEEEGEESKGAKFVFMIPDKGIEQV
jgi:PAS domain S-box-containing protein